MNKESEKLLDEKESQFGCGEILDIQLFDAPEFNEIIDRVGEDNELVQFLKLQQEYMWGDDFTWEEIRSLRN